MSRWRHRLLRRAYALGWRLSPHLSDRRIKALSAGGARLATLTARSRTSGSLATWRHNISVLTGRPCTDELLRRGVASYLRNFGESLALVGWTDAQIDRRVTLINDDALRSALAGPGAVVVLPHSGNWDLAGAWAARNLAPVTTVAEQLDAEEFAAFLDFRTRLGLEVLAHTDRAALPRMITAIGEGRMVCLIGDRDLAGAGLAVDWPTSDGRRVAVTMPAGPALVARRSGATLIPAITRFSLDGLTVQLGDPVPTREGRDGLRAMTQDVCTFFATELPTTPEDWHLFQPFFPLAAEAR